MGLYQQRPLRQLLPLHHKQVCKNSNLDSQDQSTGKGRNLMCYRYTTDLRLERHDRLTKSK